MAEQMTAEQQEELRKKLESMSPEELREFQKKQCIFCHIVSGKVAAKKIFEDSKVVGILDINPANPGHVLLLPKEHYMIMPQLPEDELKHIFCIAKQISNALLRALDVRGTNIIVANGPAAGQKAQHFMVHIIPRKDSNDLRFTLPSRKHTEQELDMVAENVRKRLNQLLGVKEKEKTAEDILKSVGKGKVVEGEFKDKEEAEESGDKDDIDNPEDESASDSEPENRSGEKHRSEDKQEEEKREELKKSREKEKESDSEDDGNDIDLDAIARVLHGK